MLNCSNSAQILSIYLASSLVNKIFKEFAPKISNEITKVIKNFILTEILSSEQSNNPQSTDNNFLK